jgi:hypothetical protein
MYLHMVGMAVAAVVVVDGEHVGALFLQQLGQARRGFFDISARKRSVVVVRGFARHSRVAVAEEFDPIDAQDLGRGVQLGDAALRERLARPQCFGRVLTQLAAGREHQDDPMPFRLGARHRARGCDRLVVGVSMEGHERVAQCDHLTDEPDGRVG